MRRGILGLVFVIGCFGIREAAAGGGAAVAIRNDGAAAATVSLEGASGVAIDFGSLAPHTTSVLHPIDAGGEARVVISSGSAKPGAVTLRDGGPNVISVSESHAPSLDAAAQRKPMADSGSGW
jgi:hypothetical protein